MSATDDVCDFCNAYCDPIGCDTAKLCFGEEDMGKLWCGQCKQGRSRFYESYLPLSNGFLQAVIICDSHDLKLGNYDDGFQRARMLDRIYDFSEMLKDRGVRGYAEDCDCETCNRD